MDYFLKCTACKRKFGKKYGMQICSSCGSLLEVVYIGKMDLGFMRKRAPLLQGIGRFFGVLPDGKYREYFVGYTPMVKSKMHKNLFMKLELLNPTNSFKDRGSVIEVAKAKEYGYSEVVCASTGNMAYSIAYYSKLYGLKTTVFISRTANKDKLLDIKGTKDAKIVRVDGDFTKAQGLAELYAHKNGAFLAGDYCYRKEGQKIIAYETILQLGNIDSMIVPVGNATLISGIYKGFMEMLKHRIISKLPHIIAVQSTGSNPLARAFNSNGKITYMNPHTKADAIAVGNPTFGIEALGALSSTDGMAISVTDKEMEIAQKRFYSDYGLIAELGGVASLAALSKIRKLGRSAAIISGGNV